ncbi:MAG: RNA polymerase sigma factor [Patescibacteria group bacterium]|nr:RNA polymerase sigma factor [Patescibacteria group bacterium]
MNQDQLKTLNDLEAIFQKWNTAIYRYIYARLNNQETAEDITQEVFIKAWQARDLFDDQKSSLKNWLYAIAINTIRDHLRKVKGKIEIELDENIQDDSEVKGQAETQNLVAFVFSHLEKLQEREQEIIILRYQEDLELKEIAEILNLELSATKVALHRAVQKLRDLCNDESE